MARWAWRIAAPVALVAAGLLAAQRAAAQGVAAQDRTWDVSVKRAEKTMELQPGWDFVPINDPASCLMVLELAVVHVGPAGPVPAPRVAVEDDSGGLHGAWGNLTCVWGDGRCGDLMGWLLSATHATPDTATLAAGDTLSAGSLTYYFEVPRASKALQLHFGEDPPLALEVVDRLTGEASVGLEAEVADPATSATAAPAPPGAEGPSAEAGTLTREARGRALLKRALEAMGGADALAQVRDFVRVEQLNVGGRPQVNRTVRWLADGPMRWDVTLPGGGGSSVYVEGDICLERGMFAKEPRALTGSQLDERLSERLGDLIVALRCASDPGCTVEAESEAEVTVSGPSGAWARLRFDAEGRPSVRTLGPGPVTAEWTFSDWRPVGGLTLPFAAMLQGSLGDAGWTASEWRVNTSLTAEELRTLR